MDLAKCATTGKFLATPLLLMSVLRQSSNMVLMMCFDMKAISHHGLENIVNK